MYRTRRSLRFNPLGRQHFSLHHHERFSYDEMEAYRKKAWQTYREAQTRLTLRGVAVFAFCRTTLTQGFHLRAEMVTTLSLAFEDAPTPPGLQVVSRALKCMVNVTDLTVTGLANPEEDGWILRHCGFVLQRFATDLLLHSMDLLDFLERQNRILELKITNRTILPGFVLPRDILPDLKVLECPDTGINCFVGKMDDVPRPIKDIRLKLDADYIGKRDKALRAVSRFHLTLKYFSLDFEGEAVDVYAEYFDIPDIINQLGKLSNWPELRFLEFCGGHFDEVSTFVQCQVSVVLTHNGTGVCHWICAVNS